MNKEEYYKNKYLKYKLKYNNLIGGEKDEIKPIIPTYNILGQKIKLKEPEILIRKKKQLKEIEEILNKYELKQDYNEIYIILNKNKKLLENEIYNIEILYNKIRARYKIIDKIILRINFFTERKMPKKYYQDLLLKKKI